MSEENTPGPTVIGPMGSPVAVVAGTTLAIGYQRELVTVVDFGRETGMAFCQWIAGNGELRMAAFQLASLRFPSPGQTDLYRPR